MVQRRGELRLPQEPAREVGLADPGDQELQRRGAPEPDVLGPVDDAHAAAPERLLDQVAAELGSDPPIDPHSSEF